jgi:hypothetical protein
LTAWMGELKVPHNIIMGQVAWNKSSLLLKIQKSNTVTLQLSEANKNRKVFTRVIKVPNCKTWLMRPRGLIKGGR